MNDPVAAGGDAEVLARWWAHVVAAGTLPPDVATVQARLVRAVGRGELPSGAVFVKVMALPRRRDRLRYLLRALPAAHEAAMLARVRALPIPTPEVVAVRTARRCFLPFRSMLVLRALLVRPETAPPRQLLAERAAIAARLCAAGLCHPDLNGDNFVRLNDGRLALLDLQSLRRQPSAARSRRVMACRLLLEADGVDVEAACALLAGHGLVVAGDPNVVTAARHQAIDYVRHRIARCYSVSTEFERHRAGCSVEHRRRGELPPGRWWSGGGELVRAWLGQRRLEVCDLRAPRLPALRRHLSWRGARAELYVPADMADAEARREFDLLQAAGAGIAAALAVASLAQLRSWRRPSGSTVKVGVE